MKGVKMRVNAYLDIAERTFGSRGSLSLLRWALAIVFLWFGGMKFTSYEAHGNAALIDHSPLMSWLNVVFGVQGASYVIGGIELSTAVMLILGGFNAAASALGAAMSSMTFVITLSFFLTTPGVAEPTAGGFPAISAPIGQFLLKDLVLLAASVNLLLASIRESSASPCAATKPRPASSECSTSAQRSSTRDGSRQALDRPARPPLNPKELAGRRR
jgi:uncharacterized membrane protein YkgB